ncbi:hypothetical protein [Fodinibius sp.]|uniref:hypothetical protein n=1 Tax=Fodinibius sp. TaxID=1872440 RepID=UPI002ACE1DA5|nr:hypothetical protein [Fodinibius sp.]MDZ7659003.1 hypothetical protein [Fodinibius sp.]
MTCTIKRTFNIALSGFLASLVMFLFIYIGINVTGLAPFNVPPSQAFLYNLGVVESGYALLLHFCYGTFWAFVLVYTFEDDLSILKAEVLAIVLWLFMMFVYSPLIGWGFFGFGYANNLPTDHPLYLDSALLYITITLLVHLVYGWVLGYLSSRWLGRKNSH